MNILVVEDDKNLSDALVEILTQQNYVVDAVYDGIDAIYYATNSEYDVIVLDVMLPKLNGFEVIKLLRKQEVATPTIMLTARSEITDRVAGLDSGADDYMTKPFAPEELLARIRAMSRRTGEVLLDEIKFKELTLNISTHSLASPTKSINLNNKEYLMMEMFMKSPGKIITKDSFINNIWGVDADVMDNNVEAYISFVRKKLKFINSNITVKTLRKTGYILQEVDK